MKTRILVQYPRNSHYSAQREQHEETVQHLERKTVARAWSLDGRGIEIAFK